MVSAFGNQILHFFFKFISDKIETVFWKSKENFGKLCKIKVSFKKHSRK